MQALLTTQGRVLGALVLREVRATYGSTKLGYLWAILVPAFGITLLVMIFTAVGRNVAYGNSLALFFTTGLLQLTLFNKLSNSLMTAIEANKGLLTYPPIKETDVLYARVILICATNFVIMVVFFGGLVWLGQAELPAYPDQVMLAFIATATLGFGFGTFNMVVVKKLDSWRQVEKILTRPLFFLSAIFYVPSNLPPEATRILSWNPVLHGVEWMRTGYYPAYESTILNKPYLVGLGVCLLLFGLAGERLIRRGR